MNNSPNMPVEESKPDTTAIIQLVSALIANNTLGYPRLQARLENLREAVMSNDITLMQDLLMQLVKFLATYQPIDKKYNAFLRQYDQANQDVIKQLIDAIGTTPEQKIQPIKPALKPKLSVKKHGLYRFGFLSQEKLNLGNLSDFKTIFQDFHEVKLSHKLWKDINGIPFLINGYPDDEYSCVTRVLASQLGKLLGLQCEEVFFANIDGKAVTATAFQEAVTLLENETFKLYPMATNYAYQSEQKRAFYFAIQHWTAYAVVGGQVKERFERHFIDQKGNIFLSQHEFATFLTPQQMSPALMVRLTLTKDNYRPIKDLIDRVGDRDIADIVFTSIPVDMIEAHDNIAEKLNKPSFDQRREALEANWDRLKESIQELENSPNM